MTTEPVTEQEAPEEPSPFERDIQQLRALARRNPSRMMMVTDCITALEHLREECFGYTDAMTEDQSGDDNVRGLVDTSIEAIKALALLNDTLSTKLGYRDDNGPTPLMPEDMKAQFIDCATKMAAWKDKVEAVQKSLDEEEDEGEGEDEGEAGEPNETDHDAA